LETNYEKMGAYTRFYSPLLFHRFNFVAKSSVEGSYTAGSSVLGAGTTFTGGGTIPSQQLSSAGQQPLGLTSPNVRNADEQVLDFTSPHLPSQQLQQQQQHMLDMQQTDEIVISAAMQQLRDPGVLIVAHGSRGKPKTVRLQLTESAITWRTETRRKAGPRGEMTKPKMGKLHQVPLSHIMYVDVGKQTTALRRVENAAVPEQLCFSLLTKEGSLDLEANSPRERDALVSCFSLVLDEVHAANWRDIYRGPSSDMPSSFDEVDQQHILSQQQQHAGNNTNNPNGLAGQYHAS
jgi:hypothetical protein